MSGLERGLNPEETEVLTGMSKWTRVRIRMEHEETPCGASLYCYLREAAESQGLRVSEGQ